MTAHRASLGGEGNASGIDSSGVEANSGERWSDSARRQTDVFIVGCPRSGTTWVQAVLSQHTSFATPPETDLFGVLRQVDGRYWNGAPLNGLWTAIPHQSFDEWRADLWWRTRASLLARSVEAVRILEKTPAHVFVMDEIRRLAGPVAFVSVVRDPVDVVRSILDAAAGFGLEWAPDHVERAVEIWIDHTTAAIDGAREDDTIMVRYEDLLGDATAWEPVLEHIGIPTDWRCPAILDSALEAVRYVTAGDVRPSDIVGAAEVLSDFGSSRRDLSSRRQLSPFERRYVRSRARELAIRAGFPQYADARDLGPVDRLRVRIRSVRRSFRGGWNLLRARVR